MLKNEVNEFFEEEHKEKKKILILSIISMGLLLILLSSFFIFSLKDENLKVCGDGTEYSSCSKDKPYYCENGILVERASSCGCPDFLMGKGESCLSKNYYELPREIQLSYLFNEETKNIDFISYKEIYDYVAGISRFISYGDNETPLRKDFKLKKIENNVQREFILPLVKEIQNIAPENKIDQARIAISLVQNIPWKVSEKDKIFSGSRTYYSRYPYEVLYEKEGICGEKSELLALLLKELGYETAIFYFQKENHELVGIKCPVARSFRRSGYCLVETSAPSILNDKFIVYTGGISLESDPEIIEISKGISLPNFIEEYFDAIKLNIAKKNILPERIESSIFSNLQKKYGLVEDYYLS